MAFAIRNMEENGCYTTYECSFYHVKWHEGGLPPSITLYGNDPMNPAYIDVAINAYVMNDAGRTIDRVGGPGAVVRISPQ